MRMSKYQNLLIQAFNFSSISKVWEIIRVAQIERFQLSLNYCVSKRFAEYFKRLRTFENHAVAKHADFKFINVSEYIFKENIWEECIFLNDFMPPLTKKKFTNHSETSCIVHTLPFPEMSHLSAALEHVLPWIASGKIASSKGETSCLLSPLTLSCTTLKFVEGE